MMALGYLISNSEESLNLLCRINIELKRYIEDPLLALAKNRKSDLSTRDYAICMSALRSHLCTLVSRIFDPRKGMISFVNIEWFKQPKIKETLGKIRKEEIIQAILKTRHTFIAHVDPNVQDIISVDQICDSTLKELLEDLNRIYNLWLLTNNVRRGSL